VRFDATTSLDPGGAVASGVDPATTTWAFKDGNPIATGARVSHVFNQVGTFVGELRDRAGNLSGARAVSVTVDPGPGAAATGGSLGGVTGRAAFRIDRLRVRARYVRSRLAGSIALIGSSARAGALRAELRRRTGGRPLARVAVRPLPVGAFARTVRLPAGLVPGTYRVAFHGPGRDPGDEPHAARAARGRHQDRAREPLRGPRGRPVQHGGPAGALPARTARRLVVAGAPRLGSVPVTAGALIRATLPAGAVLSAGRLRADLRAGRTVVGRAATRAR
jgi:hypothetical protein